MSYSQGHPVRLLGGRLVLDFVNTADWSSDNRIVHEKLNSLSDLDVWMDARQMKACVTSGLSELLGFRSKLRELMQGTGDWEVLNTVKDLQFKRSAETLPSFEGLLASSAISILVDPGELNRIKKCPGENCGWLFIDETKNSRRIWCSMETCGNRAKASRHYAKRKQNTVSKLADKR